jgi:hypothetical protein
LAAIGAGIWGYIAYKVYSLEEVPDKEEYPSGNDTCWEWENYVG